VKYFRDDIDESLPWAKQEQIRQRRMMAYLRQLEKLRDRISKPAFWFFAHGFCDESLHDGRLLSFVAGDGLAYVPDRSIPFRVSRPKSSVVIQILNFHNDALYTFRYKGLRRIICDKPPHRHFTNADDFDDLLMYELTQVNDHYLRHEYEFASGASIIVEFRQLIFRRQPIRGQRSRSSRRSSCFVPNA